MCNFSKQWSPQNCSTIVRVKKEKLLRLLVFIKFLKITDLNSLLCARHWAKHFINMPSFNPHCFCTHLNKLKVEQLAWIYTAGIRPQVYGTPGANHQYFLFAHLSLGILLNKFHITVARISELLNYRTFKPDILLMRKLCSREAKAQGHTACQGQSVWTQIQEKMLPFLLYDD